MDVENSFAFFQKNAWKCRKLINFAMFLSGAKTMNRKYVIKHITEAPNGTPLRLVLFLNLLKMRQYVQIPMDFIKADWWLKNECARTLYIELSQRASYKESQDLPLGCCFFGRLSFGEKYGYSDSKVRTALSILVNNGAIKVTPAHTKSIVEVVYISEFLAQKNHQPNNQPNNQPNDQLNHQPNYTENQKDIGGVHQPNNQLNDQLFDQPNDHKHNLYNSITDNLNKEECMCEKSHKRTKFKKPTLQEIQEFAFAENLTNVDCERFFDYYESNGWKVGRNAMKDWHATLRNWNRMHQNNVNTLNSNNYEKNRLKEPHVGQFTDEQFDAICEMGRLITEQNSINKE